MKRSGWRLWAWAFVYWILFSLLAVAFIVDYPLLSLGIALVGAAVLASLGMAWARGENNASPPPDNQKES